MSTEVRVPTLGESVTEATVATWFKKIGDQVAVDEMLCELETDKVTVEVPSPIAGTISEIVAPEGATVSVEALLAQISEGTTAQAPTEKNLLHRKPLVLWCQHWEKALAKLQLPLGTNSLEIQ